MLKCLTFPELEAWCASIGEDPSRRALQLWRFMYKDGNWLRQLDDAPAGIVQNGFSQTFRDKVCDIATLDGGLELVNMHIASDGTRKLVLRLTAGPGAGGEVETVIIPIVREAGSKERITLCVSSQVGCAMGCQFCFTGRMGLLGNLTPGQIVEQVVVARRLLFEEAVAAGADPKRYLTPITNIVFMGMVRIEITAVLYSFAWSLHGHLYKSFLKSAYRTKIRAFNTGLNPLLCLVLPQGEPLDNLEAVLPALHIAIEPLGLHFSYNKITVSTVGLVPQMRRLAAESRAVMAVSLHAATDEVRDAIVPVNRRHSLKELVGVMEELFPINKAAPRHGHHVLIEYTLLSGVNDRGEDARALLELLKNVRCKINLIVFNPHEGTRFAASTPEAVRKFRDVLIQGGHVATVRESRGDDKMAACGQLGDPEASKRRLQAAAEARTAAAAAAAPKAGA